MKHLHSLFKTLNLNFGLLDHRHLLFLLASIKNKNKILDEELP